MRLALATLAMIALFAQPAWADAALPQFRKDTHYPVVRAQMIKLGFEPARVLKRSENSPMGCAYRGTHRGGPGICERWPEILHCSEGISRCDFLYFRKRDGARVLVVTEGDNDLYECYCFVVVRWPDNGDRFMLEEALIAKPAFARRAVRRER